MYGQNHLQGGMLVNGASHQRYQNIGINHKFQQQGNNQSQNQHNRQQQGASGGPGHHHTYSSSTTSNNASNFTPGSINSHVTSGNGGLSQHWQTQLQIASESRNGHLFPHRHAKKAEAVQLIYKGHDDNQGLDDSLDQRRDEAQRLRSSNAASRQDWDSMDMSGQGLKIISTTLFSQYNFLTKLYLDHNNLSSLNPAIGHLSSLTELDISGNQVTEIPAEVGMLVNLRSFLLFDNQVTRLPFELGHLFRLETLGIEGNPMEPGYRDELSDNGTKALITSFRDEFLSPTEPRPREWQTFQHTPAAESLSVMSYNILCDKYATTSQYGYTPAKALLWENRRELILKEISSGNADVVCLQEVDRGSFQEFFQFRLASHDYRGMFYPKTRARNMSEKEAKIVDGCAIFYKAKKFICLDKMLIDLASMAINRPDMKTELDIFNRVMPRDNIALVAFLENRATGARLMVANAHIFWDPAFADVKLVQVAIILEEIHRKSHEWAKRPPCTDKTAFRHGDADNDTDSPSEPIMENAPSRSYASGPRIPLILCGDFNSAVGTGVYDLITQGYLAGDHEDFDKRTYGNLTKDGIRHPFKLKSAYGEMGELRFTNYTPGFTGVLDYIWFSSNAMEVKALLGNVDEEYLRRIPGFPHIHFPSDHLPLQASFTVPGPSDGTNA